MSNLTYREKRRETLVNTGYTLESLNVERILKRDTSSVRLIMFNEYNFAQSDIMWLWVPLKLSNVIYEYIIRQKNHVKYSNPAAIQTFNKPYDVPCLRNFYHSNYKFFSSAADEVLTKLGHPKLSVDSDVPLVQVNIFKCFYDPKSTNPNVYLQGVGQRHLIYDKEEGKR